MKLLKESRHTAHDVMKQKTTGLSERYFAALNAHLNQGPVATLQPALKPRRQAFALGLTTLELQKRARQAKAHVNRLNLQPARGLEFL